MTTDTLLLQKTAEYFIVETSLTVKHDFAASSGPTDPSVSETCDEFLSGLSKKKERQSESWWQCLRNGHMNIYSPYRLTTLLHQKSPGH